MNHVILIGNIGGDADTKFTNGGAMIVSFSLATTSKWVDKQTGNTQERTEWHRCNAWGERWKNVVPYLTKGTKVSVIGEIRYRKVDKDGSTIIYTDIVVESLELLGSKRDGGERKQADNVKTAMQQMVKDSFDDDLPFM